MIESTVFLFMSISVNTLIIAVTCIVLFVIMLSIDKKSKKAVLLSNNVDAGVSNVVSAAAVAATAVKAPSPKSWPIIGNLYSLAGYELPYQSFGALAKKFGNIISLQLGVQPAVVVNGINNIKEVLITKSSHFDSRPNFKRYHDLFSGNKENCKYDSSSFLKKKKLLNKTRSKAIVFRISTIDSKGQITNSLNKIKFTHKL